LKMGLSPYGQNEEDNGLLLLTLGIQDDEDSFRKAKNEIEGFKDTLSNLDIGIGGLEDLNKLVQGLRTVKNILDTITADALPTAVRNATAFTYGLSMGENQSLEFMGRGDVASVYGINADQVRASLNAISKEYAGVTKLGQLNETEWTTVSMLADEVGVSGWQKNNLVNKFAGGEKPLEVYRSFFDDLIGSAYDKLTTMPEGKAKNDLLALINKTIDVVPWASQNMALYEAGLRTVTKTPVELFTSTAVGNTDLTTGAGTTKGLSSWEEELRLSSDQKKAEIERRWKENFVLPVGVGYDIIKENVLGLIEYASRTLDSDTYNALPGYHYNSSLAASWSAGWASFGELLKGDKDVLSILGYKGNMRTRDFRPLQENLLTLAEVAYSAENEVDPVARELTLFDAAYFSNKDFETNTKDMLNDVRRRLIAKLKKENPKMKDDVARAEAFRLMSDATSPYYSDWLSLGIGPSGYMTKMTDAGIFTPQELMDWVHHALLMLNVKDIKDLFGNDLFTSKGDVTDVDPTSKDKQVFTVRVVTPDGEEKELPTNATIEYNAMRKLLTTSK
jgi:hypothetical protein